MGLPGTKLFRVDLPTIQAIQPSRPLEDIVCYGMACFGLRRVKEKMLKTHCYTAWIAKTGTILAQTPLKVEQTVLSGQAHDGSPQETMANKAVL